MKFLLIFPLIFLTGCATISKSLNPEAGSDQLASDAGFKKEVVRTQRFNLTAYSHIKISGQPIVLYVEGDGRAWLSKNRLSNDPTPFHPLVLQLATQDPSPNVVYLGRPCQYGGSANETPCDPGYWSNKRFSEEVIASMNEAVDYFSKKGNSSEIYLVGYSGGGAIAVLVAARRQDVRSIRTIAGNLDPEAVNRLHETSPLTESLNPIHVAKAVSRIPQIHFTGLSDSVVSFEIAENFLKASEDDHCIQIVKVPGASHEEGWVQKWPELLKKPFNC